jgi:hypothetical protein
MPAVLRKVISVAQLSCFFRFFFSQALLIKTPVSRRIAAELVDWRCSMNSRYRLVSLSPGPIGNSGERERRDTGVGLVCVLTTYRPHQNNPSVNFVTL